MDAAFDQIADKHRKELVAHCYRMLGSLSEAEDAVQETLVKAWRALPEFEQRASLRTWLYRIATNACLDALDKRKPRRLTFERFPAAAPDAPLGPPLERGEFFEPCPDALWQTIPQADARISSRESVALAFIAALEQLPPLQRAVLLLRDVMDFSAAEVGELVGKSPQAVESALERARAGTPKRAQPTQTDHAHLLQRYLSAWEAKDPRALTSLLSEDARLSMPPLAAWFSGREAIGAFLAGLMSTLPTVRGRLIGIAGGVGVAVWSGVETLNATSLSALSIEGDRIVAVDTFLGAELFPAFGLPATLAKGT